MGFTTGYIDNNEFTNSHSAGTPMTLKENGVPITRVEHRSPVQLPEPVP
jgi:hypothetical protein